MANKHAVGPSKGQASKHILRFLCFWHRWFWGENKRQARSPGHLQCVLWTHAQSSSVLPSTAPAAAAVKAACPGSVAPPPLSLPLALELVDLLTRRACRAALVLCSSASMRASWACATRAACCAASRCRRSCADSWRATSAGAESMARRRQARSSSTRGTNKQYDCVRSSSPTARRATGRVTGESGESDESDHWHGPGGQGLTSNCHCQPGRLRVPTA